MNVSVQLALNDTNINTARAVNQRQLAIYVSARSHPSSHQPGKLTNAYLLLSLMPQVRLAEYKPLAQIAPDTIDLPVQKQGDYFVVPLGDIMQDIERIILANIYIGKMPSGCQKIAIAHVRYSEPGVGKEGKLSDRQPVQANFVQPYQPAANLRVQQHVQALAKYRLPQLQALRQPPEEAKKTLRIREEIDKLDALTGVEDHLQFADAAIERLDIPDAVRVEIQELFDHIKKRRSDRNLYLAVIGEFSSGKSTFINALLRDELLKTSALVTTAAATKLHHGDTLEVEVRFTDSRVVKTNPHYSQITIPRSPGVKGISRQQFIHLLTANDSVAKDVVELNITHPSEFLANGIVIIDTPGTNATNALHADRTRKILENSADAAIIIVPATVPLSQTLSSFLAGTIRPFLHRCIFVVSRIDQIRQREQSGLLTDLRSRLVLALDINPPILYTCSAQVVMDELSGEETVPQDLKVWKERFVQLEKLIISRLSRERTISISENVLRMLTRMFEQLEEQLRSQWLHYEIRQQAIKRESIPDFNSFTTERINAYVVQYKETIEEILKEQNAELQRLNKLQEAIRAELQEIDRRRQFIKARQSLLAAVEPK